MNKIKTNFKLGLADVREIVVEVSFDAVDNLRAETAEGSVGSDGEGDADEENEENFRVHVETETVISIFN